MSSVLVDSPRVERVVAGHSLSVGLADLSPEELGGRLQDLERMMRHCEAAMIAVMDEADRRGAYSVDGHRSIRGWAGATVRWSDAELRDRCRTVTLARDVPEVVSELTAGRIGVAQVRELARVRANPRCGAQIVQAAAQLIEHAENMAFTDFRLVARGIAQRHRRRPPRQRSRRSRSPGVNLADG